VGICGSDLHYFEDGGFGDFKPQLPLVLGHEPTGEVLKTGAGVSGWSRGDRAMLEPRCIATTASFAAPDTITFARTAFLQHGSRSRVLPRCGEPTSS
jgi:NADPH:quinone reductase-like Zn-dependent oxidoreductase